MQLQGTVAGLAGESSSHAATAQALQDRVDQLLEQVAAANAAHDALRAQWEAVRGENLRLEAVVRSVRGRACRRVGLCACGTVGL